MVELDVEGLAILGVDAQSDGLANLELGAEQVNTVLGLDLLVVGGVGEGQRKHTLLLQVGLVDTGEGTGDDSETTEVTGLQSGVLTGGSLTVVPVTNNNPLDATGLVVTGSGGDRSVFTSDGVLDLVGLTVLLVDGTDKHVVGDVVQVSTVLQPGTGHGDVVGGSFALALDQDGEVGGVLAVPRLEGSQDLETVTLGRNSDLDRLALGGRSLVGVTAGVVSVGGETLTSGGSEQELVAILVLQLVGKRVELEGTGNGHGDDQVGRGDESVGSRVGVVTASEVTVVGGDDGVGLALLHVLTVPLSNARTAGVGEDNTTELLESLKLAITLNGGTDLLGTGGNGEQSLGLDTVVKGVTSDGGGTGHVLVGGVGARTDQTDLELLRPLVGLDGLLELGDGSGKVRSEGTVDVRLELGKVDLNQLVVLGTLILTEFLGVLAGEVTNVPALGGVEVVVHAVVEGEERGGGTDFSTHVTDGTHTSARQGLNTRTVVLDDGTSTTLDSEETSDLQDDICGSQVRNASKPLGESIDNLPLGEVQPDILPVSLTPMTLGAFSSQGRPAMTSTASAPPTPMAAIPRPPALGV